MVWVVGRLVVLVGLGWLCLNLVLVLFISFCVVMMIGCMLVDSDLFSSVCSLLVLVWCCSYWCRLVVVMLVEFSVMCWWLVCCNVWLNWLVMISRLVWVLARLCVRCFSCVWLLVWVCLMMVLMVLLVWFISVIVCLKWVLVWCSLNLLLLVIVLVNFLCSCVSWVCSMCSCCGFSNFSWWVLVMFVSNVVRLLLGLVVLVVSG